MLETLDGRQLESKRGDATGIVRGEVGEIFLWLWGRKDAARVEVSGEGAELTGRVHP